LSLLTCCYNFYSSTSLGSRTCSDCSSTTCWNQIFNSSSKSKITSTCGVGADVEVVVLLRKLGVVSNSCSNSLLFYSCSKIIISSTMGAREASGST
jgi:hypothetical protein